MRRIITALTAVSVIGIVLAAGFFTRATWLPWLTPAATDAKDDLAHGPVVETQQLMPVRHSVSRSVRMVSSVTYIDRRP